jgi:galactose oxidase
MGVLLQGFYKKKPNNAVPSPADGDQSIPEWWDKLASEANALRKAGFTAVWLPPVLKNNSGADPGAAGYEPFDDYDIGSRTQKGTRPTRYGTREELQRCVAILRANGIDVYVDMVEHHRMGDPGNNPRVFRYPGADGTANVGRFPKNPTNFVPIVPRDPDLGGPVSDDLPFGRELAPIDAKPLHYVSDNLIAAADWLTRALDIQGYRLDDVKGLSTDFLRPFLNSKSMAGKFAVGEFFDGNRVLINNWISNPRGMNGRSSAFDFPLKFTLTQMCNNPGQFNMAALDHVGLTGISPFNAVTFVENHDTDLSAGQSIITNKILGYAYILTSEGYPCVYYRDYDMGPDGFKLKPFIDNLIWIHENLASGPTQQRFKEFDVFAYERTGGPRLLVALNNNGGDAPTITVATGFGPHKHLHDYSGHAPDVMTDAGGNVTINIPKNSNGFGYVCYSVAGQNATFNIDTKSVTQDFEGAEDLDILPAINGKSIEPATIWPAANTAIRARLTADTTGWTNDTSIKMELIAPDGTTLATSGTTLDATAKTKGLHTFRLTLTNAPAAQPKSAYTLSVTYTAPTTLDPVTEKFAVAAAPAVGAVQVGQWTNVINLPNVPIHAHLLSNGKILFWGRRNPPGTPDFPSLNQHATTAFTWDPANDAAPAIPTTNQPADSKGAPINLFCSGHTFLADGRLLVAGGHLFDSQGHNCSTFYDPLTDKWTAGPPMNEGRWYPSMVTLADGRPLVCSGSFPTGALQPPINDNAVNNIPQVLENDKWNNLTDFEGLPLFPRFHVAPDGSVLMSGALATTYLFKNLTLGSPGTWTPIGQRHAGNSDYAPSVMYDTGKVIFIGGGLPTHTVETIDLNAVDPAWTIVAPLNFPRRQHNATLLPDGTVLVTGGTQGQDFDNLTPGEPIHAAELWNPATGAWTKLAPESVDRCYHSTAVLLPDGRVFSGGGGEYAPVVGVDQANPPANTHANAQIFSPPYLFKGQRPVISNAPKSVTYGAAFNVETPAPNDIGMVTWIRLSSVTHSCNMNQRINFLTFERGANQLMVKAPATANACPPGHYMLFLLDHNKVPSVARIIQITAPVAPAHAIAPATPELAVAAIAAAPAATPEPAAIALGPVERDAQIRRREPKPPIVVGVTPTCPYGISACWGGAYEALSRLPGVRKVLPLPNAYDSTAFVYLHNGGLPDLDAWAVHFKEIANGTHLLRGVEVTLEGMVRSQAEDSLILSGTDHRPPVLLSPILPGDKVQYDATKKSPKPLEYAEQAAWQELQKQTSSAGGSLTATVTGPLLKNGDNYMLEVREFAIEHPVNQSTENPVAQTTDHPDEKSFHL